MNMKVIYLFILSQLILGSVNLAQDTLKLDQAIVIAIQNNYDITLAAKDSRIVELDNTIGTAGMLPQLDLTGARSMSINNTYQKYYDGREKQSPNAKNNNISGGVALAWTLFDGFNMFIQKNRLTELENMSDIQLQSVVENAVADVIQAYYAIITQQKMVEVYQEAMTITSERKRIAKAGVTFGSNSELSFLQASVDYNADSSAYIQQVKMLQNNKVEINRLLCRNLFEPFEVTSDIPVEPGLLFEKLWLQVKEQNPEIRMARTNLSIALLDRKSANSTLYPRLNFSSGYTYSKSESEVGIMSMNRNRGFNVGVNATYTIFDGFTQNQNRSKAQIRLESAKLEAEQAELNTKAHLQRIYNDYQTNLQLSDFEKENIELAMRNLAIAREKYRIGSSNDIELRETQKKLMDAENRYLTARFRSKASETELLRMSGQLTR
ncbi:MAG: TolC family protein [Porphyromonadaceae bacterium]|nr:MAG: TolC family protein [Porphyromonadaceae bacterium]